MKTLLLSLTLLLAHATQTESTRGIYYPSAYESECFTDACLGDLTWPYDGEAY